MQVPDSPSIQGSIFLYRHGLEGRTFSDSQKMQAKVYKAQYFYIHGLLHGRVYFILEYKL
jgi:hypothetical protein